MTTYESKILAELAEIKALLLARPEAAPALAAAVAKVAQKAEAGKKRGRKPKAAAEAGAEGAPAEPKPKREMPEGTKAWNALVAETLADMRANGWEGWTAADGKVWAAAKRATVAGKAGSEEAWVFSDSGKAPSPANGGYVLASYRKAQKAENPEEALAKARKYREDRERQKAAKADSASEGSGEGAAKPKSAARSEAQKAKWAALSEEEKAERLAKLAEGRKKRASAAEPAAAAGGGAAEAKPAAEAEEEDDFSEVDSDAGSDAEEEGLEFTAWQHGGKEYGKNQKGYVIDDDGNWVGLYSEKTGKLDRSAPRPANLDDLIQAEA